MTAAKRNNALLWTLQTLLAALFLFAGVMKFILPIEMLRGTTSLPALFIRFVGVLEVAGAIGLILPGLLRIRQALTPLAAIGLIGIMTGATVVTMEGGAFEPALIPLVVGILSASVAYGRRHALHGSRTA